MTLTTTITIISTLAGLFIRIYFENKKMKRRIDFLEEQSRINQMMRFCISRTPIQRFLILKLTNSANELIDGILRRYLVSAVNEEHDNIHVSILDMYQQIPVDDQYKKMVLKSFHTKFYKFVAEEEEDCDLKMIYKKEGIKYGLIYFIHLNEDTIYFCSLSCYENSVLNPEDEQVIETTIAKIRESYKRYYS